MTRGTEKLSTDSKDEGEKQTRERESENTEDRKTLKIEKERYNSANEGRREQNEGVFKKVIRQKQTNNRMKTLKIKRHRI